MYCVSVFNEDDEVSEDRRAGGPRHVIFSRDLHLGRINCIPTWEQKTYSNGYGISLCQSVALTPKIISASLNRPCFRVYNSAAGNTSLA